MSHLNRFEWPSRAILVCRGTVNFTKYAPLQRTFVATALLWMGVMGCVPFPLPEDPDSVRATAERPTGLTFFQAPSDSRLIRAALDGGFYIDVNGVKSYPNVVPTDVVLYETPVGSQYPVATLMFGVDETLKPTWIADIKNGIYGTLSYSGLHQEILTFELITADGTRHQGSAPLSDNALRAIRVTAKANTLPPFYDPLQSLPCTITITVIPDLCEGSFIRWVSIEELTPTSEPGEYDVRVLPAHFDPSTGLYQAVLTYPCFEDPVNVCDFWDSISERMKKMLCASSEWGISNVLCYLAGVAGAPGLQCSLSLEAVNLMCDSGHLDDCTLWRTDYSEVPKSVRVQATATIDRPDGTYYVAQSRQLELTPGSLTTPELQLVDPQVCPPIVEDGSFYVEGRHGAVFGVPTIAYDSSSVVAPKEPGDLPGWTWPPPRLHIEDHHLCSDWCYPQEEYTGDISGAFTRNGNTFRYETTAHLSAVQTPPELQKGIFYPAAKFVSMIKLKVHLRPNERANISIEGADGSTVYVHNRLGFSQDYAGGHYSFAHDVEGSVEFIGKAGDGRTINGANLDVTCAVVVEIAPDKSE